MDNVKRVEKALDQITKLSVQGYSVLTEAERQSPFTNKIKVEDLARIPWRKLSRSEQDTYGGVESDKARIADIEGPDAIYQVIVDGNKMSFIDENGSEYLYDFDKIHPITLP
jgi:hypothetical protein